MPHNPSGSCAGPTARGLFGLSAGADSPYKWQAHIWRLDGENIRTLDAENQMRVFTTGGIQSRHRTMLLILRISPATPLHASKDRRPRTARAIEASVVTDPIASWGTLSMIGDGFQFPDCYGTDVVGLALVIRFAACRCHDFVLRVRVGAGHSRCPAGTSRRSAVDSQHMTEGRRFPAPWTVEEYRGIS
jgi:hypothetical protein